MRMAQDCHMYVGDGELALAVVAKRMNLYDDTHPMYGSVLGMLAAGCVEVGQYDAAEEIGFQAVAHTKGGDTNAVQAVMSATHLTCKGLIVTREVLDHAADNSGPGRHPFSFIEGCFRLNTGDFNGALENFDLLLERCSDPTTRYISSLTYATMLLILVDVQVRLQDTMKFDYKHIYCLFFDRLPILQLMLAGNALVDFGKRCPPGRAIYMPRRSVNFALLQRTPASFGGGRNVQMEKIFLE